MSAATAQACVVCHGSSSKYKCPTCRSATCSLACSKQHASQQHPSPSLRVDDSQASSSSRTPIADQSLPPLHLRNETVEAPNAQRFGKIAQYVGLNQYDSKQLMEDFEYLQYLGKCVTLLGKDISKNGWLKEMEQKTSGGSQQQQQRPQQDRHGKAAQNRTTNGYHQHVPAEVRNRHTFESWIRKLRLPIMLVPDGMSLRKENHTRWKNNTKQLFCTVEIRMASATRTTSKGRSLLHHISWHKKIAEVVIKEAEKIMKQKGKGVNETSSDMARYMKGVSLDKWRESLCIAVTVSNERLRNESSSKFLEWWQRQVKNGMVKADGLEFDEEKKEALDLLRKGAWAAIEGMDSAETMQSLTESVEDLREQATTEQQMNVSGLISSTLLDKMQAARVFQAQQSKAGEEQKVQEVEKDETSNRTRRKMILLNGSESFQDFLQNMPKSLAIVEYFRIEVWPRDALFEEIKRGSIIREMLEGSSEVEADVQSLLGKHSQDGQETGTLAQAKKVKIATKSNALGNLTAYASSEEDEDEDEGPSEEDGHPSDEADKPARLGGLAEVARSLGMVPPS